VQLGLIKVWDELLESHRIRVLVKYKVGDIGGNKNER